MAKFRYKMQSILNIKYKLEEQAKMAFGEAKAVLIAEEEKLSELKKRKEGYHAALKRQVTKTLDVLEIKRLQDAVETMKYQITLQEFAVTAARQKVEQARVKLNGVMIERKTHEKLKEKEFDVFVAEINAAERTEIDQLVSFSYSRTDSEEED